MGLDVFKAEVEKLLGYKFAPARPYAFERNTDDYGWVKGDNGKEMIEVELPNAREDVDSVWAASRSSLAHKPPPEKEHRDAATKQADHDRNSRTNVVLAWVGTNMYV